MRARSALAALALALALAPAAASAAQSNVLVSSNAGLREYTPAGTLVQTTAVPYPGGAPATENVRDAAVDHRGDVHVFNGTFAPYMSTLSAATGTWSHRAHPDWKTVNNVSYGGIAVLGEYVFVTSMITLNALVRFDLSDGSSTDFGGNFGGYIDLTIGRDGLLYALGGTVRVFDPETLQEIDTIALAAGEVRGIAVDEAGEIYAASWNGNIYRLAPDGSLVASIPSGANDLTDIDVDPNGRLVVGGRFGDVILTDTALSPPVSWKAGGGPVFVAFADPTFSLYPAREVARPGTPPNPPALLPGETSGPVVGAVWDPSVRPFVPNATQDFLILSSVPENAATPFGTLLCNLAGARVFTTAPGTSFQIDIAADPALVGRRMCAQGGSFTAGGRRALTNALDITIGNF